MGGVEVPGRPRDRVALVAALLGPLVLCALLAVFRSRFANTGALLLVLVIVAVAVALVEVAVAARDLRRLRKGTEVA